MKLLAMLLFTGKFSKLLLTGGTMFLSIVVASSTSKCNFE